MTENQDSRGKWIEEAERALDRASDALRVAWEDTRDVRMSTLEAAKQAATQLGKAIDEGIEAARGSWRSHDEDSDSADTEELDTESE